MEGVKTKVIDKFDSEYQNLSELLALFAVFALGIQTKGTKSIDFFQ